MDRKEQRAIGTQKRQQPTTGRQPGDPTPAEIRAACAEIRAGWSEERDRRARVPERPLDLGTAHHIVGVD